MRSLSQQLEVLLKAAAESKNPEVHKKAGVLLQLRKQNPLAFWDPYPHQQKYLTAREPIKAFFGGNGAGKTVVGTADNLIQCVDREVLPEHLLPYKRWEAPCFGRIVVPKADQIETVTLEKIRELVPRSQLRGGSVDKAYNKVNRKLTFENGSWILFNTSEQDRDAHAGVELHWVRFDEEPPGEHGRGLYTENVARLRKYAPDAQIQFTMTPLFGMGWTYDEVWERRDDPDVFAITAGMRANPHIDAEAVIRSLSHLSAEERAAVVEGKFVHFHGLVLGKFDRARHMVEAPSPQHVGGLDVVVGIDPGITQAAVIWAGFDKDNLCVVFDELYPKGMAVPEIAELIKQKNRAWGIPEQNVWYVIDPSSRNRGLANAETVIGEFNRQGIYPNPGQNDRLAGVLQLRARIEHESLALLVSRDCVHLLDEVKRWRIAKDEVTQRDEPNAKGSGGTFATQGPDHACDALRYACQERLWYVTPEQQKKGYGEVWKPDTAPPGSWLQSKGPREYHPMGSMS